MIFLFIGLTGTMLVPTLSFWLFNALLMLVDTTGKPNFITRYRIQADKNNPVKTILFLHLLMAYLSYLTVPSFQLTI